MKRKYNLLILGLLIALLLIACGKKEDYKEVEKDEVAAGKEVETEQALLPISLACDEEISQYDVTGDGIKDTISIVCGEREHETDWGYFGSDWKIYINGKVANDFEWNTNVMLEVDLYQVDAETSYLVIRENDMNNDDMWSHCMYQVIDDQLEPVCDWYGSVLESINDFHFRTEIDYMTKNTLLISCFNQFNATAGLAWKMEYEKQDGEWQVTASEYEINYEHYEEKKDGMHANQEFDVYTDISCEEEAFHVGVGDQIVIEALIIENGATFFKVKNAYGDEGVFQDPVEAGAEINGNWIYGYFDEAQFAG